MNTNKIIIIIAIIVILAAAGAIYTHYGPVPEGMTKITDMAGNTVIIPNQVNKTFSTAGSVTVLLYMLAPDKMLGWNSQRNASANQYVPDKYKNLPVLGGGQKTSYESIIAKDPDLVFVGHTQQNGSASNVQKKFGSIPVVDVEGDNNLSTVKDSIKFMGTVLGEENQSNKLINFYDKVMNQVNSTVATIPASEKKKVYYTKSADGLTTFAPGSTQTELIDICRGQNVVQAPVSKGGMGVSIELVLQWNPDVIITSSQEFYDSVYSNPLWANVNAVKNKQVYMVPQSPFNWFENPPGANSILGIAWTAKVLYPDKFQSMDLKSLTKEFYSDFYHYNLTDSDVSNILSSSGLNES
jgi:iron complex transport system substrate-binding protein